MGGLLSGRISAFPAVKGSAACTLIISIVVVHAVLPWQPPANKSPTIIYFYMLVSEVHCEKGMFTQSYVERGLQSFSEHVKAEWDFHSV